MGRNGLVLVLHHSELGEINVIDISVLIQADERRVSTALDNAESWQHFYGETPHKTVLLFICGLD